jgi:hypothetical protein
VILSLITIELISSFVLFQYYAGEQKSIRPSGSAALMLLGKGIRKARGQHSEFALSIDHGPLFDTDDILGFAMRPGRYRIREELDHLGHMFDLTVDDKGRRATSYTSIRSAKRMFVAGDSSMFGWGLYDEETIPWLLQVRLPDFEVVNVSANS